MKGHWLQDTLSKWRAAEVKVEAVLILPGVEWTGKGVVRVLNQKEISSLAPKGALIFTEQQMKRMAGRIEEKCRDVSF